MTNIAKWYPLNRYSASLLLVITIAAHLLVLNGDVRDVSDPIAHLLKYRCNTYYYTPTRDFTANTLTPIYPVVSKRVRLTWMFSIVNICHIIPWYSSHEYTMDQFSQVLLGKFIQIMIFFFFFNFLKTS